jgi:hypothetical protein
MVLVVVPAVHSGGQTLTTCYRPPAKKLKLKIESAGPRCRPARARKKFGLRD